MKKSLLEGRVFNYEKTGFLDSIDEIKRCCRNPINAE